MTKKKTNSSKSVYELRVMQYAYCEKIRAYLQVMNFYASERPINEDDIGNGIIFKTVPIKAEDWKRISQYAYELLSQDIHRL